MNNPGHLLRKAVARLPQEERAMVRKIIIAKLFAVHLDEHLTDQSLVMMLSEAEARDVLRTLGRAMLSFSK